MLCETCGVGFWHIDGEGRSVYLNPAMCELLEIRSIDDLGGATYHRFFTEESLRVMNQEHLKRPSGAPSTYEVELIGMRGGRRDVVISGAPLMGSDGQLNGLIGTFTDITARKRVERTLRESEHQLRSLFLASNDAIAVGESGNHVMANPAYVRMFGYDDESELIGRSLMDTVAPEDRARVAEYVRGPLGDEGVSHWQGRGLRRNGETFPVDVHAAEYERAGKRYVMAILRDLTAHLELEEQLRQSQKMDALGRLSGGLAHDFNNLLMVMLGCAELILAAPENVENVIANATVIHSTGDRAAGLTRQLLALSRRQVVEPKVIDLNVVVAETAEMLRRLLGPEIDLSISPAADLPPIRADAGQLQQVVMNLCLNARDAIPSTGRVHVSTEQVVLNQRGVRAMPGLAPGAFVQLHVNDTGVGMDGPTQQRAFEPFFTTKPAGDGTGLGLATVYGIVKQSGGHVSVASTPGAGTTVTVTLPVVQEPLSSQPIEPRTSVRACANTVLVVDDDISVREIVQRFLESLGYRVLLASDGWQALELVKAQEPPINVVVSDVLMHGMNGVELAQALERIMPNLPVLLMSGYPRDENAALMATRPHWAFLSKPFTLAQIADRLRRVLAAGTRRSAADEARTTPDELTARAAARAADDSSDSSHHG